MTHCSEPTGAACGPGAEAEFPRRTVWQRCKGALSRRLRRTLAWRRPDWPRAIRNAAFRLVELLDAGPAAGLEVPHAVRPEQRRRSACKVPCDVAHHGGALLDAQVLPVLVQYGLLGPARGCVQRLLASQDAHGAWADSGDATSLYVTGRVLWGLLAAALPDSEPGCVDDLATAGHDPAAMHHGRQWPPQSPTPLPVDSPARLVPAIARAAAYLQRNIVAGGRVAVERLPPGSLDRWLPPAVHLATAAALYACGQWLDEPGWMVSARSARRHLLATTEVTRWCMPLRYFVDVLQALYFWGDAELAHRGLCATLAWHDVRGMWPVVPGSRAACRVGQGYLAALLYRFGSAAVQELADRAADGLWRWQQATTAAAVHGRQCFCGTGSPDAAAPRRRALGARYARATGALPQREELAFAAALLHAAYWRARCAFERGAIDFPGEIDAHDPRLRAVLQWCGTLRPGSHVADIGCGRGRYVRAVQRAFPHLRLTGIDIDRRALDALPCGVQARRGHLLRLPAADGEFDAVLCVEALEHALLPQRAVAELCRVTRTGGTLLLIDKHAAHQRRSCHAPWEVWPSDEQLARWLGPLAQLAPGEPLEALGPGQRQAVFRCWKAVRGSRALDRAA